LVLKNRLEIIKKSETKGFPNGKVKNYEKDYKRSIW